MVSFDDPAVVTDETGETLTLLDGLVKLPGQVSLLNAAAINDQGQTVATRRSTSASSPQGTATFVVKPLSPKQLPHRPPDAMLMPANHILFALPFARSPDTAV